MKSVMQKISKINTTVKIFVICFVIYFLFG